MTRHLPHLRPPAPPWRVATLLVTIALAVTAFATAQSNASSPASSTPPTTDGPAPLPAPPELPFDDNPDPDQCGIPSPLGDDVHGTVHGWHDGQQVFPEVHLYDSHLRSAVTGLIPDGTRVQARLYQQNPTLDFYFVRWEGPDGTVEGWVPAPFFELER